MDNMGSGIELWDAPASHGLSIQGKIVSLAPPPDFRPPRLFVWAAVRATGSARYACRFMRLLRRARL